MDKLDFDKIEKQETPIYIDLRLMRNAVKEFKEMNVNIKLDDLIQLALQKKIVIKSSDENASIL